MEQNEVKKSLTGKTEATPVTGELPGAMKAIIKQLKQDKKRAAIHVYTSTLHSFCEFAGKKEGFLRLAEVFTPGRLKAYEEHLRGKRRQWNTVSTYMRTLQAVYRRLYPAQHPDYNPSLFKDVYTKVVPRAKRALEKEELLTLIEADSLPLSATRRRALAYFTLLYLLRGMPFIDLAYLQKGDLKQDPNGNYYLSYCRHKTGREMRVLVPPQAMEVVEAYRCRDESSIYLFPILDGTQNVTTEDGTAVYHSYLSALRAFNKTLGVLATLLLPPGISLSSYTARHTWATLAYQRGVPVGLISKALGHSSIRVTENYLKPFADEEVDKMNMKMIDEVIHYEKAE